MGHTSTFFKVHMILFKKQLFNRYIFQEFNIIILPVHCGVCLG